MVRSLTLAGLAVKKSLEESHLLDTTTSASRIAAMALLDSNTKRRRGEDEDDADSGLMITATPPLSLSSASEGVPPFEGKQWVLTWPANMATLDLQRLVLINRADALHRTRNAGRKRKRKVEAAASVSSDVDPPASTGGDSDD